MVDRGTVVWAPDPFKTSSNPRPWLVVASEQLPYPDEESIAVGMTTQSHHRGTVAVPSEVWVRGEPDGESHVLPWTVATLKDDVHIVGVQGALTGAFVERIATKTTSYLSP